MRSTQAAILSIERAGRSPWSVWRRLKTAKSRWRVVCEVESEMAGVAIVHRSLRTDSKGLYCVLPVGSAPPAGLGEPGQEVRHHGIDRPKGRRRVRLSKLMEAA